MKEKEYPIGGFAPGNYWNKCRSCNNRFAGDKRANQCEPCAIKELEEIIKEEPKSPKGEKASEKYWAREIEFSDGITFDRVDYDKLVSLEAKIEELKVVLEQCNGDLDYFDLFSAWRDKYQSEYDQLIKEHNLSLVKWKRN